MKRKSPASGKRQGLDNDSHKIDSSTNHKEISHLKTLQEIADKWVDRGCYGSSDRALRALIGGDL